MKITLLVIGKTADGRLVSLIEDYLQRLKHYVPFELVVIPDIKNAKALTKDQLKTAEGEAVLRFVTPAMDVLLFDEHGREFRSIEFADFLQKKMSSGKDLVLVIGGARVRIQRSRLSTRQRQDQPLADDFLPPDDTNNGH